MGIVPVCALILTSVPVPEWHAAVMYGIDALPAMVRDSEVIVVGEVTAVAEPSSGYRSVTVRVIDLWKGVMVSELKFGISVARLGCDTSDAQLGETVVLFLGNRQAGDQLVIMLEGRGRMAVLGSKEERVVLLTLPTPAQLCAEPTRIPGKGMASGAKLSNLKEYVASVLRAETTN